MSQPISLNSDKDKAKAKEKDSPKIANNSNANSSSNNKKEAGEQPANAIVSGCLPCLQSDCESYGKHEGTQAITQVSETKI